MRSNNKVKMINNTIDYIACNLNQIYIIHWLLIGTVTFVVMMADIDALKAGPSIILGFVLVVLSVFISKLYDRIQVKVKR